MANSQHKYGPTDHDFTTEQTLTQCQHDGTDGTIDCVSCGRTAADFIGAAADWMDEHDGETADDSGYFEQEAAR